MRHKNYVFFSILKKVHTHIWSYRVSVYPFLLPSGEVQNNFMSKSIYTISADVGRPPPLHTVKGLKPGPAGHFGSGSRLHGVLHTHVDSILPQIYSFHTQQPHLSGKPPYNRLFLILFFSQIFHVFYGTTQNSENFKGTSECTEVDEILPSFCMRSSRFYGEI